MTTQGIHSRLPSWAEDSQRCFSRGIHWGLDLMSLFNRIVGNNAVWERPWMGEAMRRESTEEQWLLRFEGLPYTLGHWLPSVTVLEWDVLPPSPEPVRMGSLFKTIYINTIHDVWYPHFHLGIWNFGIGKGASAYTSAPNRSPESFISPEPVMLATRHPWCHNLLLETNHVLCDHVRTDPLAFELLLLPFVFLVSPVSPFRCFYSVSFWCSLSTIRPQVASKEPAVATKQRCSIWVPAARRESRCGIWQHPSWKAIFRL